MLTFPQVIGAFIFYTKPFILCIVTFLVLWFNILLLLTEFSVYKLVFCIFGIVMCYFIFAAAFHLELLQRINSIYVTLCIKCLFPTLCLTRCLLLRKIIMWMLWLIYCICLTTMIFTNYFENQKEYFIYKTASPAMFFCWGICLREIVYLFYKIGIFMVMLIVYTIIYLILKYKGLTNKTYTFVGLLDVVIAEKATQEYKPISKIEDELDSWYICVIC